jgi:DNA-binding NtrC family response regulator
MNSSISKKDFSIFLVDDSEVCIDMYRIALKKLGYMNIQVFNDSSSCLNSLVLCPKVILLDYYMDNMDGIEILKKIKRFDPHISVVFISSQEEITVAVNALKYGAFDYIEKKDFSLEKIRSMMEKLEYIQDVIQKRKKKTALNKMLSTMGVFSLVLIIKNVFTR